MPAGVDEFAVAYSFCPLTQDWDNDRYLLVGGSRHSVEGMYESAFVFDWSNTQWTQIADLPLKSCKQQNFETPI